MKKKEEKKFKGPYWIREPLPDEDRVKYLSKEIIIERLKNGERIRFSPDCWRRVAPTITFEKDSRLKAIRRNTFEAMKRKDIIKCDNPKMFRLLDENELYSYNTKSAGKETKTNNQWK